MAGTPDELARDASRAMEPDLLARGERVDRFTVHGLLGEGGMARVYEVEDAATGERFALKVLKVPHEAIRQRLVMEGRAQGRLKHPSIVRVLSIIDVRGSPGLVMEMVDAVDLDIRLERGPLKPEELDILGTQLLDGLAYAHRQKVIHRDIKPANVLMSAGQAKLTDFGLARLMDSPSDARVTRSGMTMGTPAYMPPEQIRDAKAVDERGDVYSLGALLFEAATGRCPFEGDDLLQVLTRVAQGDRPSVRELAPELPRRIHRAIERALDPNLETRLQSVEEMRSVWRGEVDLPDTLIEQPAPGRPAVSWWFGLSLGAFLTTGALVALLLVVGTAWWMQPRRNRPVAPPMAPVIAEHDGGPDEAVHRTVDEVGRAQPAAAPAARFGEVVIQGDARVVLRGASGVKSPGRVPSGRYELVATFPSGDIDKLELRVGAGQRVVVRCDAVFKECDLRR